MWNSLKRKYSTNATNLSPRAVTQLHRTKLQKGGEDIMDIGNIKMIKDNLVGNKETTNTKEKKVVDTKQGCIKMNDYFAF
jgi:hypothetical protein